MSLQVLQSVDQFEQALQSGQPVVLYKHSSTCPFSSRAQVEIERLEWADDPQVFTVTVQQNRALSTELAERLHIEHQTPQAVVFIDGKPVFQGWRDEITTDAIRRAASSPAPSA